MLINMPCGGGIFLGIFPVPGSNTHLPWENRRRMQTVIYAGPYALLPSEEKEKRESG